jgi:glycerophosphoryl diester phosphodiesterase
VTLLLRTAARWALALPLVLFENVAPHRALGESARRAAGSYGLILAVLGAWAVGATALVAAAVSVVDSVGRAVAPSLAGSLSALLIFLSVDIGSFKSPQFATERVPTLAEALEVCKGRCKVIVELKS